MESMHEELNEISAYAYDKIGWHQFSIENTQERLLTSQMQYIIWMRDGQEMMRPQEVSLQLGPEYLLQDPSRMITISTVDETSTSIDLQSHTTIDAYRCTSIDSHSGQISASIDRERSKSIDSKAPASTDKHLVASIDTTSTPDAEQLIQNKMESMHEELNELSAYAYDKIGWHQFSIENTQERLQNISNAIHKMDERWTINDEATRSFIAAWSRMCRDEVDACFRTRSCLSTN
ncbi:hypothetical protein F2Q68_00004972 [Brassica cretica]|uniref:Uncharacterized protein n=1 Tax=Brassica cretica TaxID=69181 RepID=A0A8S9JLM1_BRACR|nr:hypothetical protein F2Q68_00004972 [Brassica cretica]